MSAPHKPTFSSHEGGESGRLGSADRATHANAPGLSSRPGHSVGVADAGLVAGEDHGQSRPPADNQDASSVGGAALETKVSTAEVEVAGQSEIVGGLVREAPRGEALAGAALLDILLEALERVERIVLEQRCERGTAWDTACVAIAEKVKAHVAPAIAKAKGGVS